MHPVDVHVGQKIRTLRQLRRMSQERLGHELGITFQQVQKYEKGTNRVSASRLWDIARVLQVDIVQFFEGFGDAAADGVHGDGLPLGTEELRLLASFRGIENATTRQRIRDLVASIEHSTD